MTAPLGFTGTEKLMKHHRCPYCDGAEFFSELGPYSVVHLACANCGATFRVVHETHVRVIDEPGAEERQWNPSPQIKASRLD